MEMPSIPEVLAHLNRSVGEVEVVRTSLADFLRFVERTHFDLIVVDLLVPRFKDSADVNDVTENILEACRDRVVGTRARRSSHSRRLMTPRTTITRH